MLRPVATEGESISSRTARWLDEMTELSDELASGQHVFSVWRMVEAAEFVATILRPALPPGDLAVADAFVDGVWRRRLALIRNPDVQHHLEVLTEAVRSLLDGGRLPAEPPPDPEPQPMGDSLRDANGTIHAAIDDHLMRHLEALTALDLAEARRWWRVLQAELHGHADAEDETVVPLYDSLADPPVGGKPEMFTAEHNGIRRLLGKLELQQQETARREDLRRAVVEGLDRYLMLRHLLEHHTLREQNILYRHLEARADAPTQERLRETLLAGRPWDLLREVGAA